MANVEEIKESSRQLRGNLKELLEADTDHFDEDMIQLIKFHGSYQQDDRDLRVERRTNKEGRKYIFMIRTKLPGGVLRSEQYRVLDRLSDEIGNQTMRITSRQDIQLHGVLKSDLRSCIARINQSGITTWGACGDVVRNVVASPAPLHTPSHLDAQQLAQELKDTFAGRTGAYTELWLDGEPIPLEAQGEKEEPIYGKTYLPRKFKFGIVIPPRNDIDVYANDVGLVPYEQNGKVEGYTFLVGGGFGMTHGKEETYPVLAKPLFYIPRAHVIEAAKAIVTTQRDYGDRQNRKHARMKYLIEDRGLEWFRSEVRSRMNPNIPVSDPMPLTWNTIGDLLGWNDQGDGRLFCGVWVPDGRVKDSDTRRYKSAFRELCEKFAIPIRLTPNCNILFHDIEPNQREEVNQILADHGIPEAGSLTMARQLGMACVSMPTCGLGLAESERVFQEVLDEIDRILRELGLEKEPILFRMTGCPNGCARPYNADFGFGGKSIGQYVFYVGGSVRGDRLARVEQKMVDLKDLPAAVRPFLEEFAKNRWNGEIFSDYWARTRGNGEHVKPQQFHLEAAELDCRL